MSWAKIKNIMIGILLLINIFLLVDIALTKYMSSALPQGTGENFVKVLAEKNITVEDSLVPHYYETRKNLSAELYSLDNLSQIFLGKKVGYVSEGDMVVAKAEKGKIAVDGNYIKFSSGKENREKDGEKIIAAMKQAGLSVEGATYDGEDGTVKLVFDHAEVEGIYLDIALDENGEIAYAEGVWPKITVEGTNEKVSVISAVLDIRNRLPEGAHITNIENIYIFECVNNIPEIKNAWRISALGRSYIVSA